MRTFVACALALSAALGLTAFGVGCGQNDLRLGVPGKGDVTLNVPGASTDGQALRVGDTSELYAATAKIASDVNGGVGFVFDLGDRIMALPPTDTDGETYAVWGPSEPRGLERNSFRFTVNKVAEG
jgi:hypothetical protein